MNTLGVVILGLIFVFVIGLVGAAYRNRYNASTFVAGVTYDLMSHEQKGAMEAIVEYRAAKKLEEQPSGEGDEG